MLNFSLTAVAYCIDNVYIIYLHRFWPNQMINAQKENNLYYWNETNKQNKNSECYLALNREYTTTEYLITVRDHKLRKKYD